MATVTGFVTVSDVDDGTDGARGPGRWNVSVTTLPTSSTEAETAWNTSWTGRPGDDVAGDQAWFYTGTESNPTGQSVWISNGSTWTEQDEVIDGNLLVTDTITADKIKTGEILTNTVRVGSDSNNLPSISGTTPSGIGALIKSDGDFFVGDASDSYIFFDQSEDVLNIVGNIESTNFSDGYTLGSLATRTSFQSGDGFFTNANGWNWTESNLSLDSFTPSTWFDLEGKTLALGTNSAGVVTSSPPDYLIISTGNTDYAGISIINASVTIGGSTYYGYNLGKVLFYRGTPASSGSITFTPYIYSENDQVGWRLTEDTAAFESIITSSINGLRITGYENGSFGFGPRVLESEETAAENNTAFGFAAVPSLTTGTNNTGVGYQSGGSLTTGSFNTFLGRNSGGFMTTGGSNTLLGSSSGVNITTGNNNVGVGLDSIRSAVTNINNTSVGTGSLSELVTGNGNSALGYQAGEGHNATTQAADQDLVTNYTQDNADTIPAGSVGWRASNSFTGTVATLTDWSDIVSNYMIFTVSSWATGGQTKALELRLKAYLGNDVFTIRVEDNSDNTAYADYLATYISYNATGTNSLFLYSLLDSNGTPTGNMNIVFPEQSYGGNNCTFLGYALNSDSIDTLGLSNVTTLGFGAQDHVTSDNSILLGNTFVTNVRVTSDDFCDLGGSSNRFDDIFATNTTIQTSDENEKQDITALSDTEMEVAKSISKLFRKYKWKKAVNEKGDDARWHTGVIAQRIIEAFTEQGLDAFDYGMVGRDLITLEFKEEEGQGFIPYSGEDKYRYNVRYTEILSFLAAYNEQRFSTIEDRLDALET